MDDSLLSDELKFWDLRLYNFLSFGPDETFLDLSGTMLTAVIGANYDTGGEDSRNGTGKSALLIDAISYALFGKTIRGISAGALVHHLARKGQPMAVILEYSRGPFRYLIERGENPGRLLYFRKPYDDPRDFRTQERKNGKSTFIFDQTLARKDATTEAIIESVGFDMVLFTYLVGLTSEAIPFVRLEEAKRRDVIESLFGFRRLTQIAKYLKKDRDTYRDAAIALKSGLSSTEAANARIQAQIDALILKRDEYYKPYERRKNQAVLRMGELIHQGKAVCIEFEKNKFIQSLPKNLPTDRFDYVAALPNETDALEALQTTRAQIEAEIERTLLRAEMDAEEQRKAWERNRTERSLAISLQGPDDSFIPKLRANIALNERNREEARRDSGRLTDSIDEIVDALNKLNQSQCPACGQPLTPEHKKTEDTRLRSKLDRAQQDRADALKYENLADLAAKTDQTALDSALAQQRLVAESLKVLGTEIAQHLNQIDEKLKTRLDSDTDLLLAVEQLEQVETELAQAKTLADDRRAAIALAKEFLDQNVDTNQQIAIIQQAEADMDPEKNPDPYTEQITALETDALIDIRAEREKLAETELLVDHLQLLFDLATKKDSFIRKQLVERWLPHLNRRIAALLKQLELPHRVRFDSEMDLHVEHNKGEYSNGNLSKGERTRLIVAVNLAFQELFEQMNYRINLLIVDELIDSGICNRGAENAVRILNETVKKNHKRAFLITHRSDIRDQVDSTLTVFKENDYSRLRWNDHEPVRT